ncbi:DHS-like NAD/FAD-binding domain-containing protein [Massariosphaeria phaeospora]|uniref:DHS-like NAD/FAD-binding domain-containing protein n=1 Tax=Massariosphaeria phaeospora TaxID=100035 RepID=A0A7C8I860_9PLEO|nr:DHS-like NAD/FAD-binding domain-containing protein [Massariosphaeria phaeospora]
MAASDSNAPSSPLSSVPSSPSISGSDLSILSRSPSPPTDFRHPSYPSPSSSQRSSAKTSPAPDSMPSPPPSNDETHPRKKRKLADPKERTTERLDLTRDVVGGEQLQLDRLLKVLHKKRKIVVIAGAGISVSAGIPDFRSSTGLFNSLRKDHKLKSSGKDLFDASVYQDDSSTSSFHDMVRSLSEQTKSAHPTAFHHLLATLAHEGRLLRLYTQNVDGIDTSLEPLQTQVPLPKRAPWPKTVQLHGGLDHMVCSKCHTLSDLDAQKFNGPVPPACPECAENDVVRQLAERRSHGIGRLRPRMVLYNEHNPDDEAIGSCANSDLRTRPDAIIVVGTTLKVPGVRRIAREMCAVVRDRRDGVAIWINNDPEPLGKDLANSWDLIVKGPCDEVARHAAMRRWNDPMEYKEVTDEHLSKTKGSQKAEVIIGTPKKPIAVKQVQGQMLTPVGSPRIAAQPTFKREVVEQPSTPSKRGTKRKSQDAMATLMTKPAKATRKPQEMKPKKPSNARSRARKSTKKDSTSENAKITDGFRVSKSAVRSSDTTVKPGFEIKSNPSKFGNQALYSASIPSSDTIAVMPKLSSPISGRREAKVTRVKKDFMADISLADARNNCLPGRPEVEALTPVKTRSPSDQLRDEERISQHSYDESTDDSRPSTASSQRHVIVKPDGAIPRDMGGLLN